MWSAACHFPFVQRISGGCTTVVALLFFGVGVAVAGGVFAGLFEEAVAHVCRRVSQKFKR